MNGNTQIGTGTLAKPATQLRLKHGYVEHFDAAGGDGPDYGELYGGAGHQLRGGDLGSIARDDYQGECGGLYR